MKKTDCLIEALILLICQLLSCTVVYLSSWILVKIIDKFVYLGYFWSSVLYCIFMTVGVFALLFLYAYQSAYRTAKFCLRETVVSSAIAGTFHLLIAAVFRYLPLLSGNTRFLAGLIAFGKDFDSVEAFKAIPAYLPPVLFAVTMLFGYVIMIILRRMAVYRRLMNRLELTGSTEVASQ